MRNFYQTTLEQGNVWKNQYLYKPLVTIYVFHLRYNTVSQTIRDKEKQHWKNEPLYYLSIFPFDIWKAKRIIYLIFSQEDEEKYIQLLSIFFVSLVFSFNSSSTYLLLFILFKLRCEKNIE